MKSTCYLICSKAVIAGFILVAGFLNGCREKPGIPGFDSASWIGDQSGCSGIRSRLAAEVINSKNQFIGQRERRIMELLGKPDRNDLYERNQKFFIYYIEPGAGCAKPVAGPRMLVVRFNATGYCNELFIQRGFKTD